MTAPGLIQLSRIPDGLLDIGHHELHKVLPAPTLIELEGKFEVPLFVSVLLHGNEPAGFKAVQRLLKNYLDRPLPRSLAVFIGNVDAARHDLRRLDGQADFNRVWPDTETPDCAEAQLVKQVYERMRQRNVFASIDIHNNTGINPHYACINRLDNPFLQLAALFGRLAVYFTHPKGVQSAAFAKICPAVTLECGRPDQEHGVTHALEFLNSCLHLTEFPNQRVHPQDLDLYHTVAQVKVDESVNFSFHDPDADLLLDKDIERFNFSEIQPGTPLGQVKSGTAMPLQAYAANGEEVSRHFFAVHNSRLNITRATMPSMLTLDERVIRQDCFCYLMERLSSPEFAMSGQ